MTTNNDEDDEFEFDDDDLDQLPANALQQLEANALLSTHQPRVNAPIANTNTNTFLPNQSYGTDQAGFRIPDAPYSTTANPQPQDGYDYGEDEVINLDDESLVQVPDSHRHAHDIYPPQNSQWALDAAIQYTQNGQNQYSAREDEYNEGLYNNYQYENAQYSQAAYNQAPYDGAMEAERPATQRSQVDIGRLLERIKKLEQEKVRLNRELQTEKSRSMSKSGEVDIVRRRLEAANKEHDRKIAALQQAHNEAAAKQKAELERIRRDREQIETNNLFLEHDLAREAERNKRVKRMGPPNKARTANASPSRTPKREKSREQSLPFRDGFDDDDLVMISPSKNRDRGKTVTPRQGGKRKRQVMDQSPIAALELSEPREPPKLLAQETSVSSDLQIDARILEKLGREDHRFELLQRLVNHRSSDGEDRVLETLTRYAFPSNKGKKLSSILYDQIADAVFEEDAHILALKFCHVFLSLWDQCLREEYYGPTYLIIDGLQFILACEPCSTAVALTERALPLIVASIDLVAIPIARAATDATYRATRNESAEAKLRQEIDVQECLNLLHVIATSCVTSSEAITFFWKNIAMDFVLLMLMKAQPLTQVITMLHILSTSSLPTTLGAIVPADSAPDQQAKREHDTLNRLTSLLFEIPEPPQPIIESTPTEGDTTSTPISYAPEQISSLRLQVLHLLTTFSFTPHGSHTLAHDPHLLSRLIRHLDACLTSLYMSALSPTHKPTISAINQTMRLLHRLLRAHPDVNIKANMSLVPGRSHKYVVALSRITFSECLVFEEGIDEDVMNAAHAILDEGLSPEEGEGLVDAFASAGTTV